MGLAAKRPPLGANLPHPLQRRRPASERPEIGASFQGCAGEKRIGIALLHFPAP